MEIQRGALLGPARPLLVLPNDEFVEDVEVLIDGLVRRGALPSQVDDFIVSLGCVLAADFNKSRDLSSEEHNMLSKVRGFGCRQLVGVSSIPPPVSECVP